MRRGAGILLLSALVVALVAAPAAAGGTATSDTGVVLAVDEEPLGPDPKPREAEDNPARELAGYENPDVPFTWGAAWILTFTGMVGLALFVGLYYLTVHRPRRGSAPDS